MSDKKRKVVQIAAHEQGPLYLCDDGSVWWPEATYPNRNSKEYGANATVIWRRMDLSALEQHD